MILESILSGGFAGAAVVALLSKLLVKNQLERSIRHYQHELDRKKESLQLELAIYAEHSKLRLFNHSQKMISALESIYGAVAHTSLPRHQFKKMGNQLERLTNNNQINAKYFELFSLNFKAFTQAFQSVTKAYSILEEQLIYLDDELEQQTLVTLNCILECYKKWHDQFLEAHTCADKLFKQGTLTEKTRTFDFDQFHIDMIADWSAITSSIRNKLKVRLRETLTPQNKPYLEKGSGIPNF